MPWNPVNKMKRQFKEKTVLSAFPEIRDWISKKIENGNRVATSDVVSISGYSRSYFLREFDYHHQISVSKYIKRERLYHAFNKVLELKNSNTTLKEISMTLGFPSQSSFSRAFKSYFGVSPSKYVLINALMDY